MSLSRKKLRSKKIGLTLGVMSLIDHLIALHRKCFCAMKPQGELSNNQSLGESLFGMRRAFYVCYQNGVVPALKEKTTRSSASSMSVLFASM